MTGVTAIVIGPAPGCADLLDRDQVGEPHCVPSLVDVRDVAWKVREDLLWLLDAGGRPTPRTLPPLLEAAPAPAVSLPVRGDGVAMEELIGRFTDSDPSRILDAVSTRRVPLRHTRVYSLLVRRDSVLDGPPVDPARFGAYAGTIWTARLFARDAGMLVPASRITVGPPEPGSPLHAARVAREGVWSGRELLREMRWSLRGRLG